MRGRRQVLAGLGAAVVAPALLAGGRAMARDYVTKPERAWRFFTDQVMGGVSEGRAEAATGAIRLTGTVSTANRGGFIQVRTELETPLPAGSEAILIEARGNGERYFVHLRTRGTVLPWQYYQAGFETAADWREVRLPFEAFAASGRLLRATPLPETVTSIGLVAYGRDHVADLEVRRLEVV
jgi:hypothetical protein